MHATACVETAIYVCGKTKYKMKIASSQFVENIPKSKNIP